MDENLVTKLVKLNENFYSQISLYFDETRQIPWIGSEVFVRELVKENISVESCLDLGCGNARFGELVLKTFPNIKYLGIDNSIKLLDFAKEKLKNLGNVEFKKADILQDWTVGINEKFSLIVAFGLLHHIPGFQNRKLFIEKCANLLKDDGVLVFTAWQFDKLKRFENSIKTQRDTLNELSIDGSKLEENDYILDWRRGEIAYRYCHLTTETEFKLLIANRLEIIDSYYEDGKTHEINKYYILRKINGK